MPTTYKLADLTSNPAPKKSLVATLKTLIGLLSHERRILLFATIAIVLNSMINLIGPMIIGQTIDHYIQHKQYKGVLVNSAFLLAMYLFALGTSYYQTRLMGGVGQRVLFKLRNDIFIKLQQLPVEFFNQNKAGDLISRINNDTDKLNQFFSQSLVQFLGNLFLMVGAGIFLLSLNLELGAAAIAPALLLYIFTKAISPWVKRKNAESLKSTGNLSAEIQESLNNFKVTVAFNRRDYFRKRFNDINQENYKKSVAAGMASNVFLPVFGLSSNIGQLIVLVFGIVLIASGNFTIGLLISFLAYINNFYNPLRQLAMLWSNLQVALAGWDRIAQILAMNTDLTVHPSTTRGKNNALVAFNNVTFAYPNGQAVLHNISFELHAGKTYAFVGPTGGGKTTTASLMARLYDAGSGQVCINGHDIRSLQPQERANSIGFILQEPFLFTGNVRENILYGNEPFAHLSNDELIKVLGDAGLAKLLTRFDEGLETPVDTSGDSVSLGQRQLIAFMRAVLRKPQLFILDEATANIDTVTEQMLEETLRLLPPSTTKVIIAHRLNTIENADEIYFVNEGNVTRAGSFNEALNLLMDGKRAS